MFIHVSLKFHAPTMYTHVFTHRLHCVYISHMLCTVLVGYFMLCAYKCKPVLQVYITVYIHTNIYTSVCTYISVYCVCMYLSIYVCTSMHACIYMYTCLCIYRTVSEVMFVAKESVWICNSSTFPSNLAKSSDDTWTWWCTCIRIKR